MGEKSKGPFLPRFVIVDGVLLGDRSDRRARIGRALLNPLLEELNFLRAEFLLGGHLQVFLLATHRAEKTAVDHIAGDQGGAAVATCFPAGFGVEHETTLGFAGFVRMAFVAALFQNRLDLFLKGNRSGVCCAACARRHQHQRERAGG